MSLLSEVKRAKKRSSNPDPETASDPAPSFNEWVAGADTSPAAPVAPVAEAPAPADNNHPDAPKVKFSDAFAAARKAARKGGPTVFEWEGGEYSVQTQEEAVPKAPAAVKQAAPVEVAAPATPQDDGRDVFGNARQPDYKTPTPVMVRPGQEKEYLRRNRPEAMARLQREEQALFEDKNKQGAASFDRQVAKQAAPGAAGTFTENLATGAATVGQALMSIPETAQTGIDAAKDLADTAARKIGVPEWMLKRKFVGLDDITTKPLARGVTIGGRRFAGFNDIAETYRGLGEMAKTPEGQQEGQRVKTLAANAQDQALNGDFSGVATLLSDPNAWATVGGQALPFLAATFATKGDLKALMGIEAGAAEVEIQEYENRTGTKVDNIAAASAILQRAAINGTLERLGFKAITGKLPDEVMDRLAEYASKNLMTKLTTRAALVTTAVAGETGTEMLQKFNENAAARGNYNDQQAYGEDVLLEGMGGAAGSVAISAPQHIVGAAGDVAQSASNGLDALANKFNDDTSAPGEAEYRAAVNGAFKPKSRTEQANEALRAPSILPHTGNSTVAAPLTADDAVLDAALQAKVAQDEAIEAAEIGQLIADNLQIDPEGRIEPTLAPEQVPVEPTLAQPAVQPDASAVVSQDPTTGENRVEPYPAAQPVVAAAPYDGITAVDRAPLRDDAAAGALTEGEVAATPGEPNARVHPDLQPVVDYTQLLRESTDPDERAAAAEFDGATVVDPSTLLEHSADGFIGKEEYAFLVAKGNLTGQTYVLLAAPSLNTEQLVIPGVTGSRIYINTSRPRTISSIVTAGHESTHLALYDLRNSADPADRALAATVDRLMSENLTGNALERFKNYYGQAGLSPRAMLEEAAADIGGNLHADPKFYDRVIAAIEKEHGPTGVRKYVAALRNALRQLSALLRSTTEAESTTFSEDYVANLEATREAVAQALIRYYVKNGTTPAMAQDKANLGLGIKRSTRRIREGKETLKKFGVEPGKKYNVRQIAAALELRYRSKHGEIKKGDHRPEVAKQLSDWMTDEVLYALAHPEESGAGWYSTKYQRALDTAGEAFPELKTDQNARDLLTAVIAVTSDGQSMVSNFRQAMDVYDNYRQGKGLVTERGHQRQDSVVGNLARLTQLQATHGPAGMHTYLLQENTVSKLKKIAEEEGLVFNTDYQAHIRMPLAAVLLGPKIGAFYANLMGSSGYLTMDRWFSRTVNRYRGTLLPKPTPEGLARFRELLGKPELSDGETADAAVPYRNTYLARGYKNGSEIEKAANTIYKAAFEALNDVPYNASDRTFMLHLVNRAQAKLARKGHDISVADIQAILWYYEKRLYGELGAKKSADISYAEAADQVVAGYLGDRPAGPAVRDDAAGAVGENTGSDSVAEPATPRTQRRFDETTRGQLRAAPYARRGGAAGPLRVLARYRLSPALQQTLNTYDVSTPDIHETTDAASFSAAIQSAKAGSPFGAAVYAYSAEEYRGMRLFLADGGKAGFALKGDDIVSVFNNDPTLPGVAHAMLPLAVQLGGRRLDAFDTVLPALYAEHGFKTAARVRWVDDYTPTSWDKPRFAAFNNGEPDVAYMVYDAAYDGRYSKQDGQYVDDAAEAVALQQKLVDKNSTRNGVYSPAKKEKDNGRIKRSDTRDGSGREESGRIARRPIQTPERPVQADERGFSERNALAAAPRVKDATGPDPLLVSVAERYARDNGITLARQAEYTQVDEARARRIADAYAAMPHAPQDPKVKEAYANLIHQTTAQYQALVDAGYRFWFTDPDSPSNTEYLASPWNAMRDIRATKTMGTYPTDDGFGSSDFDPAANPLLEDTGIVWPVGSPEGKTTKRVLANDLFRAVHDAFGHGLEGSGFRAQGEENAWQAHVRLFTGSAVGALTSETRGQNSWLNYGPNSENNQSAKVEDTVFADQKTGLMPEWTWTEGRVGDIKLSTPRNAPNGKPSNLTDHQWQQVRTPEFKAWFGDWEKHASAENPVGSLWSDDQVSKVVDDNGEPLVVYHGTDRGGFSSFRTPGGKRRSDLGIFTTPNLGLAESYITRGRGGEIEFADMDAEPLEGGNDAGYYASYMNLRKPYEEDFEGMHWAMGPRDQSTDDIVREARSFNEDGAIIRNVVDPGPGYGGSYIDAPADVFVALDPAQLKSATQNTGAFDATSSDMRFSRPRQIDTPEFKKWFGDSKVVDAGGKPLVVYHGTHVRPTRDGSMKGDILAFDRMFTTKFRSHSIDTVGSWFSTSNGEGGAAMYAGGEDGSMIYPVYLSIKNPHNTTFALMLRRARLLENGKDDGRMVGEKEVAAFRKWLGETGKDGIHITHDDGAENGSTEFKNQDAWIALEPTQIKSAIGNDGSFDATNPDIRRSPDRVDNEGRPPYSRNPDERKTREQPTPDAAARYGGDRSDASDGRPAGERTTNLDGDRDVPGRAAQPDAASGRRVREAGQGTGYGRPRKNATQVDGVHYSAQPRSVLDSSKYGTGARGAEAKRLNAWSASPEQKQRIHFYVDEAQGIVPETGVGDVPHPVRLNNLYDWKADPLTLWDAAVVAYPASLDDQTNHVEQAVMAAGFDGVYARGAQSTQGVAVLLGEHQVPVPVALAVREDEAPVGIPSKLWQLHLAERQAVRALDEPQEPNARGEYPTTGELKRRATMAFRKLNNAVKAHVVGDENAAIQLLRDMNTESRRREQGGPDIRRSGDRKTPATTADEGFNRALRRGVVLEATPKETALRERITQKNDAVYALAARDFKHYADGHRAAIAKWTELDPSDPAVESILRTTYWQGEHRLAETSAAQEALQKEITELSDEINTLVARRVGPPEHEGMLQLNEHQRYQVETPQFKAWFRESKVVAADGRPLIAFHGSSNSFDAFAPGQDTGRTALPANSWFGQLGSWFAAPSKDGYETGTAESVADTFSGLRDDGTGVIYPVFLSIQNPYESEGYDDLMEQRDEAGGGVNFKNLLLAKGYDGVVVRDSMTDGDGYRDDWVAFYPAQIKSAIGNDGSFDATNPDIRRSGDRKTPAELRADHARMFGQGDARVVSYTEQAMAEAIDDGTAATRGSVTDEETASNAEALGARLNWNVEQVTAVLARGNIDIDGDAVPASVLLGTAATTTRLAIADLLDNPMAPDFAEKMAKAINLLVATRANLSEIGRALRYAGVLQRPDRGTAQDRAARTKGAQDALAGVHEAVGDLLDMEGKSSAEQQKLVSAYNDAMRDLEAARMRTAEEGEALAESHTDLADVRQQVTEARQARDAAKQLLSEANAELKKAELQRTSAMNKTPSAFEITRAEGAARRAEKEAEAAKEWNKVVKQRIDAAEEKLARAQEQLEKARTNKVDPAGLASLEKMARLKAAEAAIATGHLKDAEQKMRDAARRLKDAQQKLADARAKTPSAHDISQAQGAARQAELAYQASLVPLRAAQRALLNARARLAAMKQRMADAAARLLGVQKKVAAMKKPVFVGKGGVSMAEINAAVGGARGLARIQRAIQATNGNLDMNQVAQFFQGIAESLYTNKLDKVENPDSVHRGLHIALELFRAHNLTGIITHKVNFASNAYFHALEMGFTQPLKQLFTSGVKGTAQHYTAYAKAMLHSIADVRAVLQFGITQEFPAAHFEALTKARPGTRQDILDIGGNKWMDQRPGKIPGVVGKVVRSYSFSPLGAMDMLFKIVPYRYALNLQKAQGKPADYKAAIAFAEYMTFQDDSPIAATLTGVIDNHPMLGFLIPYVLTLVNLIKRSLDYTPVVAQVANRRNLMGANGVEARNMALAQSVVGLALAVIAIAMHGEGEDDEDSRLTGAAPLDRDKKSLWLENQLPISMLVGDEWWDLSRMEPVASALSMDMAAADAFRMGTRDGEWGDSAKTMGNALAQVVIGKSFMVAPRQMLDAAMDQNVDGLKYFSQTLPQSILMSIAIPNFFSQVGDLSDPIQRDRSAGNTADSWLNAAKRKIPGKYGRESLEPALDYKGEVQENAREGTLFDLLPKAPKKPRDEVADWLLRNDIPLEAMPGGLRFPKKGGGRLDLELRQMVLQRRAKELESASYRGGIDPAEKNAPPETTEQRDDRHVVEKILRGRARENAGPAKASATSLTKRLRKASGLEDAE